MTDLSANLPASLTSSPYRNAPIGVMDSGVGGLSILRELQAQMPNEDFIFVADQAHVPYGPRSLAEVQAFTAGIVRFFIAGDYHDPDPMLARTKLVVIACNTATAAAIHTIREQFPQMKFVGTEPAIKPAAQNTQRQKIGVIATAATFQGELYASLVDRYTQEVDVFPRACPEFVQLVERGGEFTAADQQLVCDILQPLIAEGIDQLVLGCTHFPFIAHLIKQCVGERVEIVDPSAAIARQAKRLLADVDALTNRTNRGNTIYATTGDTANLQRQLRELLGQDDPVRPLVWENGHVIVPQHA